MRLLLCIALLFSVSSIYAQELLKTKVKNEQGNAIRYSPNNEFLAVNSRRNLVIYNAGSEVRIRNFSGFKKPISSISFNLESTLVMASSFDHTIRIWNVIEDRLTKEIRYKEPIQKAEFIDEVKVAFISDHYLVLRDLSENKEIWSRKLDDKHLRSLAISPSGTQAAVGGADKVIKLVNLLDGRDVVNLVHHKNWIRSLAFHPDKPLLASGSDDGVVALWDLESNSFSREVDDIQNRIYGLKFSNDGSILAYGAEGLFFYSVERNYKVSQIKSFQSNIIDFDISPDGEDLATVEDLAPTYKIWDVSSLNIAPVFFARDKSDRSPPQLYIANPSNIQDERVIISRDVIDLRGTIIDESGIRNLKVNGIETPVKDNGSFVINLPLTMGDNYVTIEATDINNNIMLRKFIVERKDLTGESYVASKAKNFLLVIGINDYQHWPRLNNAVNDASDITRVLMSDYQFDFENVIMLKNEQATRNNIYNSLRSLIEKITPRDNLMLYFSGHGYYDDLLNEGYWIPVEAETNSIGDYLPNSSLLKIIENINSQHTFLVADACFSGSLFSSSTRGYIDNVEQYKSRWGLASGRLEVVSDGELGENSPFASHFIEFLETNQEPRFAVSELVQYVKVKTAEETDQTPIGNPLKSLGDEGGEFIFYRK